MVMIRPNKKAKTIAMRVLGGKAVKVETSKSVKKKKITGPYLQH
jgi:hypothetical protein